MSWSSSSGHGRSHEELERDCEQSGASDSCEEIEEPTFIQGREVLFLMITELADPTDVPLGGTSMSHLRAVCEGFGEVRKMLCCPGRIADPDIREVLVHYASDEIAFEALQGLEGMSMLKGDRNNIRAKYAYRDISQRLTSAFPRSTTTLALVIRKLQPPLISPGGDLDIQALCEACGRFGQVERLACTTQGEPLESVYALVEFASHCGAARIWAMDGGSSLTDDEHNCTWVHADCRKLQLGWDINRHLEPIRYKSGMRTLRLHVTSTRSPGVLPLGGFELPQLRVVCEEFGEVEKIWCSVPRAKNVRGRPATFYAEALVKFASDQSAFKALQCLHGTSLSKDEFNLVQVRYTRDIEEKVKTSSGSKIASSKSCGCTVARLHIRQLEHPDMQPLGGLDLIRLHKICEQFGQVNRIACSAREVPIHHIDVLVEFASKEGACACCGIDGGTSVTNDGFNCVWVELCDCNKIVVVPGCDRMRDFELDREKARLNATLNALGEIALAGISALRKDSENTSCTKLEQKCLEEDRSDLISACVADMVYRRFQCAIQALQSIAVGQRPQSAKALLAWLRGAGRCQQREHAFIVDPIEVLSSLCTSNLIQRSKAQQVAGTLLEERPSVIQYRTYLAGRPIDAKRIINVARLQKVGEWSSQTLVQWIKQQAYVSMPVDSGEVLKKLLDDGIVHEEAADVNQGHNSRLVYHLPERSLDEPQIYESECDSFDSFFVEEVGEVIDCFDGLDLDDSLLRGIYSYGFEKPSAIQKRGIKPILDGRNVVGQAQSGTGKTATYLIGALGRIDYTRKEPQVLVLAPTRELAVQIHKVSLALGDYCRICSHVCIGGTSVRGDIDKLRSGQHLIVGMLGRINDMISKRHLRVDKIISVILDDADDILLKSKAQVFDILKTMPRNPQVCLFSATIPVEVLNMSSSFMRDPVRILVKNRAQMMLEGIKHFYVDVEQEDWKLDAFCDLYEITTTRQAMVFCNTRRKVDWLADAMSKCDFNVSTLHAEMDQRERDLVMREFRSGSSRVLLTTDMLSRGIDVQHVSLIMNYDLPSSMDTYLHCVGRCGRFGRQGIVINLVTSSELQLIRALEAHWSIPIKELSSIADEI